MDDDAGVPASLEGVGHSQSLGLLALAAAVVMLFTFDAFAGAARLPHAWIAGPAALAYENVYGPLLRRLGGSQLPA
jgi:hypothetical protein